MARRSEVTVFLPDGTTYPTPRRKAFELVQSGAADWKKGSDYCQVTLNQKSAMCVRGLSCRVGQQIATDYRAKEPYAEVMVAHIRLQRESPSDTAWG